MIHGMHHRKMIHGMHHRSVMSCPNDTPHLAFTQWLKKPFNSRRNQFSQNVRRQRGKKSSTRVVKKQIHGKSSSSVHIISHMAKFKNSIQVNDELPLTTALYGTLTSSLWKMTSLIHIILCINIRRKSLIIFRISQKGHRVDYPLTKVSKTNMAEPINQSINQLRSTQPINQSINQSIE